MINSHNSDIEPEKKDRRASRIEAEVTRLKLFVNRKEWSEPPHVGFYFFDGWGLRAGANAALVLVLCVACCTVSCRKSSTEPEATSRSEAGSQILQTETVTSEPEAVPFDTASVESESERPELSPTNRLSYCGYYNGPDGAQALIEDLVLRVRTFNKVGQEAFGYTVKAIESEQLVLENNGAEFVLLFDHTRKPLLTPPGITPENYPPMEVINPNSTGTVQTVAPPPPESQRVQSIRADQIPAGVQTQLQQRLQQKARDGK